MGLLEGLKAQMINPLFDAEEEISMNEALECDLALEAVVNTKLSDEDIRAILDGDDDIDVDDDEFDDEEDDELNL